MGNMLRTFTDERFGSVRTVLRDGEPWFVAADVCRALELSNPTVSVGRLDDDERAKLNLGRQGEGTIVSEPGLYALVLGSRKQEAKAFKRWITHEVIPAIRKHGGYLTPEAIEKAITSPDFLIRLATTLKEEQEKNKELMQENAHLADTIEMMRPDYEYAQSILATAKGSTITTVGDTYGLSPNELNRLLHLLHIQKKNSDGGWLITAKYAKYGYTDKYPYHYGKNKEKVKWQMNWTFRGIQFLYNYFKNKYGALPMREWRFDGTDVKLKDVLRELEREAFYNDGKGADAV
jgi:prophage antirepressor-like protein